MTRPFLILVQIRSIFSLLLWEFGFYAAAPFKYCPSVTCRLHTRLCAQTMQTCCSQFFFLLRATKELFKGNTRSCFTQEPQASLFLSTVLLHSFPTRFMNVAKLLPKTLGYFFMRRTILDSIFCCFSVHFRPYYGALWDGFERFWGTFWNFCISKRLALRMASQVPAPIMCIFDERRESYVTGNDIKSSWQFNNARWQVGKLVASTSFGACFCLVISQSRWLVSISYCLPRPSSRVW